MKKLFGFLFAFSAVSLCAQNVLFHENFDQPSGADMVNTGSISGSAPISWNDTNLVSVSGNSSYHVSGSLASPANVVYFETDAFSTVGNPFVKMSFSHIAKIFVQNEGRIMVSTDSGATFTQLGFRQYLPNQYGGSPLFYNNNYFNEAGYNIFQQSINTWRALDWLASNGGVRSTPDSLWWVGESFDLTGLASDTSNGAGLATGYANVKIRFETEFKAQAPIGAGGGNPPALDYLSGWYVDDLKVEAANCELNPPTLDMDFSPVPCYVPKPEGSLLANPNGYQIGAIARDTGGLNQSGIESVAVFFSVNGLAFQSQNMLDNLVNFEYKGVLDSNQVQVGDTVRYFVMAYDTCGNIARLPLDTSAFFKFWVEPSLPSKCGFKLCANRPELIHIFPWVEDFESNDWLVGVGQPNHPIGPGLPSRGTMPIGPAYKSWSVQPSVYNARGWSVMNGTTPTANTGPNGDHTTGNGKYLYCEFTPNSSVAQPLIVPPCVDLRDSVPRELSFWYHQYGADINRLRIDIDTGADQSAFFAAYEKIKGQRQVSPADSWKQYRVDLSPFQGKIIRIHFRALRSGSGDKADIAIDDLKIADIPALDVAAVRLDSPATAGCNVSSGQNIVLKIANLGAQSMSEIPVAYQLDGGATTRDTVQVSHLNYLDSATFVSANPLVFNTSVSHSFKIWTELPGDANSSNDTLTVQIGSQLPVISQFPYYFDFEDATVATASDNGNLNSTDWELNAVDNGNGPRWTVAQGYLYESKFGPFEGLGENQKFAVLRSDTVQATLTAKFQSACLDLRNATQPEIRFAHYLRSGRSMTLSTVEEDGTETLLKTISGTSSDKAIWKTEKASLQNFIGKTVQLVFAVNANKDVDYSAALDNIQVTASTSADVGLYYHGDVFSLMRAGDTSVGLQGAQFIHIAHNGVSNSQPFHHLGVVLQDACDPSSPAIAGQTGSFPFSQTISNNFSKPYDRFYKPNLHLTFGDTLRAGRYNVKLWISRQGDSLAYNDTLYFETNVLPSRQVPYFNDFES